MAPWKRAETCSCEISFNINCLIDSCVRLYNLCIYILLFTKHKGNVSPNNYLPDYYLTEVKLDRGEYRTMIIYC